MKLTINISKLNIRQDEALAKFMQHYNIKTRVTELKKYTKEDLITDVDWLIGHGIDEAEAESFLLSLVSKTWVKE